MPGAYRGLVRPLDLLAATTYVCTFAVPDVRAPLHVQSPVRRLRFPRHRARAQPVRRGGRRARHRAVPDGGRGDRGGGRLRRRPEPVRADHRARRDGTARPRDRQPDRRRIRHHRHRRLRPAWRVGRQFPRLRRRRGGDARAGARTRDDAQRRRVSPRHRRRQVALRVVGQAAPRDEHDARHRRARPHRQADGAHRPQRVRARRRLRSVHHRRRFPGVRGAARPRRAGRRERRRFAARAAHAGDARDDRRRRCSQRRSRARCS